MINRNIFFYSVFISGIICSNVLLANDLSVYTGFRVFQGIYNIREVNSPTDRMPGFHILSGARLFVSDSLFLRFEGMYNQGYDHTPSTNYSSFTIRSGFELNGRNPVIVPYFLLGVGVAAYDPPRMDMQEGYVTSATFGTRIPFGESGYSIDFALEYSYSTFNFSLVSGKTHLDRMGIVLGFIKHF